MNPVVGIFSCPLSCMASRDLITISPFFSISLNSMQFLFAIVLRFLVSLLLDCLCSSSRLHQRLPRRGESYIQVAFWLSDSHKFTASSADSVPLSLCTSTIKPQPLIAIEDSRCYLSICDPVPRLISSISSPKLSLSRPSSAFLPPLCQWLGG